MQISELLCRAEYIMPEPRPPPPHLALPPFSLHFKCHTYLRIPSPSKLPLKLISHVLNIFGNNNGLRTDTTKFLDIKNVI